MALRVGKCVQQRRNCFGFTFSKLVEKVVRNFQPITERIKAKSRQTQITFCIQLKTAVQSERYLGRFLISKQNLAIKFSDFYCLLGLAFFFPLKSPYLQSIFCPIDPFVCFQNRTLERKREGERLRGVNTFSKEVLIWDIVNKGKYIVN